MTAAATIDSTTGAETLSPSARDEDRQEAGTLTIEARTRISAARGRGHVFEEHGLRDTVVRHNGTARMPG